MTELRRLEGGTVTSPQGFLAGAAYAGIKAAASTASPSAGDGAPLQPPGAAPEGPRPDVGMLVSDRLASVAAMFTTNRFPAAPVQLSRERAAGGRAIGVVFNSGCANACTGRRGLDDARHMAELAARKIGASPEHMLVASTGVIGVPLALDRLAAGLERVELSPEGGRLAARCIMTTDRRPKEAAVEFEVDGRLYRVGGIAKGAGMIHPNMATMLAFLTTDLPVEAALLRSLLRSSVDVSFNMISIDRDTSTNDTVVLFANGAAGGALVEAGTPAAAALARALNAVCIELAQAIARDGEGATRLIEVEVRGARTIEDARVAARAVAGSNLVKAAVYGADPNWGRVLAAVGYSGAEVDPDRASVVFGGELVAEHGLAIDFDAEAVRRGLRAERVRIEVDLHLGAASAVAWGCDLTEGYVVENSAYTT